MQSYHLQSSPAIHLANVQHVIKNVNYTLHGIKVSSCKGVVNRFLTNNAILWETKRKRGSAGVSLNKSGVELAIHIVCTRRVS